MARRSRRRAKAVGASLLFGGAPDCQAGYVHATWDLFGSVYTEAGVLEETAAAKDALDASLLPGLAASGVPAKYNSNKWIGRVGQ